MPPSKWRSFTWMICGSRELLIRRPFDAPQIRAIQLGSYEYDAIHFYDGKAMAGLLPPAGNGLAALASCHRPVGVVISSSGSGLVTLVWIPAGYGLSCEAWLVRASSSASTSGVSAAPICWNISSACRRRGPAWVAWSAAMAHRPRPASA